MLFKPFTTIAGSAGKKVHPSHVQCLLPPGMVMSLVSTTDSFWSGSLCWACQWLHSGGCNGQVCILLQLECALHDLCHGGAGRGLVSSTWSLATGSSTLLPTRASWVGWGGGGTTRHYITGGTITCFQRSIIIFPTMKNRFL